MRGGACEVRRTDLPARGSTTSSRSLDGDGHAETRHLRDDVVMSYKIGRNIPERETARTRLLKALRAVRPRSVVESNRNEASFQTQILPSFPLQPQLNLGFAVTGVRGERNDRQADATSPSPRLDSRAAKRATWGRRPRACGGPVRPVDSLGHRCGCRHATQRPRTGVQRTAERTVHRGLATPDPLGVPLPRWAPAPAVPLDAQ